MKGFKFGVIIKTIKKSNLLTAVSKHEIPCGFQIIL